MVSTRQHEFGNIVLVFLVVLLTVTSAQLSGYTVTALRPDPHIIDILKTTLSRKALSSVPDAIIVGTACRKFSRGCSQAYVDYLQGALREEIGNKKADELLNAAARQSEDKPYGRGGGADSSTACRKFGRCSSGSVAPPASPEEDAAVGADKAAPAETRQSVSQADIDLIGNLRHLRAIKQRELDRLVEEHLINGNPCPNLLTKVMISNVHFFVTSWADCFILFFWDAARGFFGSVLALAVLTWLWCLAPLDSSHVDFLNSSNDRERGLRYEFLESIFNSAWQQFALRYRLLLSCVSCALLVASIWGLPRLLENTAISWLLWWLGFPPNLQSNMVMGLSAFYGVCSIWFTLKSAMDAWNCHLKVDGDISDLHVDIFGRVGTVRNAEAGAGAIDTPAAVVPPLLDAADVDN